MSIRSVVNMRALRVPSITSSNRMNLSTTSRLSLKESSSQTDADYEKHKQDSLQKQKAGNGHWKPELASDSEEAVKADRHNTDDPKTLQEKTKHVAGESSKAGTSVKDSMS